MRAADVVGLDLQPRDRVGPGFTREHEVVVPLVAVGLLRGLVDLDHAAPDETRSILQAALVKEVALAPRSLVMLERVVDELLPAFREHHAVDLRRSTAANERDVLRHL